MKKTIVLASGNAGKLKEFQQIFSGAGIALVSQSAFDTPEAEESGESFIENAIIKARNAARQSGYAALADDSGLEVDALDGRPGIYSARFSEGDGGLPASDQHNNEKLLRLLESVPEAQRSARFIAALVYMRHAADPTPLVCVGRWEGSILSRPQGDNGFGYDPLFYVEEFSCASAELPAEIKNQHSHRAKALAQLMPQLAEMGSAT